jgi:hypothetical protein
MRICRVRHKPQILRRLPAAPAWIARSRRFHPLLIGKDLQRSDSLRSGDRAVWKRAARLRRGTSFMMHESTWPDAASGGSPRRAGGGGRPQPIQPRN